MGTLLNLQQPLVDSAGIRSVNFFNGRLLTGKDLGREQDARRESDWRLGQAIGEGVAFGFDINEGVDTEAKSGAQPTPVLRITPGLAINRNGQVLRLESDTSVRLVRKYSTDAPAGKIFDACPNGAAGFYLAGSGVYILTIAPAETGEGKAPTNGLDVTNVRCNTDATVETVQFRLLQVPVALYAGLKQTAKDFRNRLAYLCFGSANRSAWLANLFGPDLAGYGMVDAMRGNGLTDYDVPLALVFLAGSGSLQFLDRWSVRRTPYCGPDSTTFMSLTSARRAVEGQAMFLQFQEHLSSLRTPTGDLGTVTAQSHFPYLPPAGVIPVPEESNATDAQATHFFKGLTYRGPAFINGARLESLVRESLCYPPIDTQSSEFIWLCRVHENRLAIDFKSTSPLPRSYVVFASGHLPYRADAQFDASYWNYSNYALDR